MSESGSGALPGYLRPPRLRYGTEMETPVGGFHRAGWLGVAIVEGMVSVHSGTDSPSLPGGQGMHQTEQVKQDVGVDALEELFGSEAAQAEIEAMALGRFGFDDELEQPQAIGSVVLTVRVRC